MKHQALTLAALWRRQARLLQQSGVCEDIAAGADAITALKKCAADLEALAEGKSEPQQQPDA